MDLPPSGQTVQIPGIVIYRFEDGKIAEAWVQADMLGMMQQIGALEEAGG